MKMETGRLFATMKMQQVGLVSAFRCFLLTLRLFVSSHDVCAVDAGQPEHRCRCDASAMQNLVATLGAYRLLGYL